MSFDRERSAGYMTNWAARLFARAIDQRLKAAGVSSGHMPVFFALAGGRALTQKELARLAAIEQPTMAATLARMERDGLIERRADPADRRSSLVSLTAKARRKAEQVTQAIAEINGQALAGLGEAERAVFLDNLATVVAALERLLAEDK
jgi:MarR family transcriptional regulator, transcriptional regulator for hemolysin